MKKWLIIVILMISMGMAKDMTTARIRHLDIQFYDKEFTIYYDYSVLQHLGSGYNDQTAQKMYHMLEASHNDVLYKTLIQYRDEYKLNDWLYYNLVKSSTDRLLNDKDYRYRTLLNWYIMAKSGYRVKLYSDNEKPYLFAYTEEKVYDMPYIKSDNGRFLNLTYYFDRSASGLHGLSFTDLMYNDTARAMKFGMTELPAIMNEDIASKTLSFNYRDSVYEVEVQADKSQIAFQRRYPKLDLDIWAKTPVSNAVKNSLVPAFKEIIKDKSESEAVRMILSFTRQAFEYKTDMEAYNEVNLIFTPEEILLSPYSDCEDRAVLFSYMVKELLGLESVLLEYPSHISAAVALSRPVGSAIWHNGNQYTFCEPTGPQDQLAIGQRPSNIKNEKYKIVRLD